MTSAADFGNYDAIRVMKEAEVNLEQLDGNGWSPIHAAARKGHVQVSGEGEGVWWGGGGGRLFPIHAAARNGKSMWGGRWP